MSARSRLRGRRRRSAQEPVRPSMSASCSLRRVTPRATLSRPAPSRNIRQLLDDEPHNDGFRWTSLLPQAGGFERISLVVEVAEAHDSAVPEGEQFMRMRPDLRSANCSPADLKPEDQRLIETRVEDPQHLEPVLVKAVEPSFERLANSLAASDGRPPV